MCTTDIRMGKNNRTLFFFFSGGERTEGNACVKREMHFDIHMTRSMRKILFHTERKNVKILFRCKAK